MSGTAGRREQVVDLAIALAFAVLSILLSVSVVGDEGVTLAVSIVLGLAHTLPLAVRRRWPVQVIAAMAATAVLTVPAGIPVVVLGPAVLVGTYTVGARLDPARSVRVLAGVIVVMTLVVLADGADLGTLVTNAVANVVAWWLGDRTRRGELETQTQRAAAAEAARRAALDERLRIARELHDVVAHAMTVIAVQAGTGRFVIERSPEVAAEALATIESTSRDALQEMRRLLAVLREDESVSASLLPAPGLGDLDDLVAATCDVGVDVRLETTGPSVPLPSGLDLSVYRIVQEALTNVRKHAQADHAVVRVSYETGSVQVEITDDGVGPGDHDLTQTDGHGLAGMRERAALYGGTLEVEGVPSGGVRVAARFPLADAS